jgi:TolA-binding protein
MDCEKFDAYLMDELADELDEVTHAAMKRHADGCARCAEQESGMRATLSVGRLPLVEPSDDLEERILEAAFAAHRSEPWHRKLVRSLSWAGSHAMRPQFAMAALLVLMLGASVLLLPARQQPVSITPGKAHDSPVPPEGLAESQPEAPAAEPIELAQQEAEKAPAGAGRAAPGALEQNEPAPIAALPSDQKGDEKKEQANDDALYDRAMTHYRSGNHSEAQKDFAEIGKRGGQHAASAALYEARAVRAQSGCKPALGFYDRVRQRYGSTSAGLDAAWEQADCHNLVGETDKARELWTALTKNEAYGKRAAGELAAQANAATAGKPLAAQQRAARATPPSASPPKPSAPAGGSTGKAPAAPKESASDNSAF